MEIECRNGAFKVDYYVNCFERMLSIIFFNLNEEDIKEIEDSLDDNYCKWHDSDTSECCEEYMIDNLHTYYKNHIAAVIYGGEEE